MSGIISKEQLGGGFQRWQINSFDPKPVISPPTPPVIAETVTTTIESVAEIKLPTAEDIERMHEEAHKEGYAAGFAEGDEAGKKAGEAAAQEAVAKIKALIGSVEKSLADLDQTVAYQVLDLALEVATQLSRGVIKTKKDYLIPIIKEAIACLPMHHAHVTLHLNPSDAAAVRASMGEQLSQSNMQIFENNEINPGGCRLSAGASEVDATIETRWTRVLEAIGAEPSEWLNQN
jgi:flagellar assembly protein FliH